MNREVEKAKEWENGKEKRLYKHKMERERETLMMRDYMLSLSAKLLGKFLGGKKGRRLREREAAWGKRPPPPPATERDS